MPSDQVRGPFPREECPDGNPGLGVNLESLPFVGTFLGLNIRTHHLVPRNKVILMRGGEIVWYCAFANLQKYTLLQFDAIVLNKLDWADIRANLERNTSLLTPTTLSPLCGKPIGSPT